MGRKHEWLWFAPNSRRPARAKHTKGPMTTKFEQCQHWVETHRDVLFDCLRIYLGVGLFIKGIYFLMHPELFAQFTNVAANSWLVPLAWAVPYVHMLGGALLALGVFAWLGALIQLPVLIGAVFFVNLPHMIDTEGREAVEFSALVLFLVFLIFLRSFLPGANPLSILQLRKGQSALAAGEARVSGGHDDLFVDLIRIYLGIGLLIKGVYFMEHREHLVKLLEESGGWVIVPVIAMHYVVPAHFAGGLLLALGLITRLAAVVQLPILLGASFYIYLPKLISIEGRQNFEFTTLVLFLMALVTIHGSGCWSVDHLLSKRPASELDPTPAT